MKRRKRLDMYKLQELVSLLRMGKSQRLATRLLSMSQNTVSLYVGCCTRPGWSRERPRSCRSSTNCGGRGRLSVHARRRLDNCFSSAQRLGDLPRSRRRRRQDRLVLRGLSERFRYRLSM